jgi:hypothetical protein
MISRLRLAAAVGVTTVVALVSASPALSITNGVPDGTKHPNLGLLAIEHDGVKDVAHRGGTRPSAASTRKGTPVRSAPSTRNAARASRHARVVRLAPIQRGAWDGQACRGVMLGARASSRETPSCARDSSSVVGPRSGGPSDWAPIQRRRRRLLGDGGPGRGMPCVVLALPAGRSHLSTAALSSSDRRCAPKRVAGAPSTTL